MMEYEQMLIQSGYSERIVYKEMFIPNEELQGCHLLPTLQSNVTSHHT